MDSTIKDLQERISHKFDELIVKEIVKKQTKFDTFEIVNINLGIEATKGDNFLSEITRFSIQAKDSRSEDILTVNVIVKAYPKSLGRRKTFRTLDFFKTEIAFYQEVWPKLDAFQTLKNAREKIDSVPNILAYYIDEVDGFIALEDFTFTGFATVPRDEPLDLEHVEILLKWFARFHALAVAYRKENEEEFQRMAHALHENYFSEELRSWMGNFYHNIQGVVKDAVKKELDNVYYEKVCKEFDKDNYGEMAKLCADHTSPLVALTHGDPWIPNFLFQYSDDKPRNVILIDYQLARVSSIALDLLFFIYTCTSPSLRATHFPRLLNTYTAAFNVALTDFGASAESHISVVQLRAELKRCIAFGLGICSEANVMSLLDHDEVSDLDDRINKATKMEEVFAVGNIKVKEKRQRVAGFVRDMIDEGFV